MSVTLGALLEDHAPTACLLLVWANAFSVYTVAFSVLEFYYVKAIGSAVARGAHKINTDMESGRYNLVEDVTRAVLMTQRGVVG